MNEDMNGTLLKHYLDKNGIEYKLDEFNYRILRVDTNGLTQRQIKLIKKISEKVDKMKVESIGFGLITIDIGHYGGLE